MMALGDSISAALLAKGDGWAIPWLGGDSGATGHVTPGRKAEGRARRSQWYAAQNPLSARKLERREP